MADNKVTIEIAVEGNAEVQFKKLAQSAKDFGEDTKKGFDVAGASFASFAGNLAANAVAKGFELIAAGIQSFVGLMEDAVAQAAEQEVAINRLNASLAQSGNFSAAASKELQDFASNLQKTTKYSDDAVISATALISSLSGLDKDGLKKATEASLNLASALQIDLQSAANLVGKAAEGNVSELSRYGIQVKETGDKAKDFAVALEKIQNKFGNAASSEVNTYTGALAQLQNNYNDVLKVVGEALIQNPTLVALIKSLGEQFSKLSNYVSANKEQMSSFISNAILVLIDVAEKAASGIDFLERSLRTLYGTGQIVISVLGKLNVPLQIIAAATGHAKEYNDALNQLANDGLNNVKEGFVGGSWTDKAQEGLKGIAATTRDATEASKEAAVVAQEQRSVKIAQSEEDKLLAEIEMQNKAIQQETQQANSLISLKGYLTKRNEELKKYDDDDSKRQIEANNKRLSEIQGLINRNTTARLKEQKEADDEQERRNKLLKENRKQDLNDIATLSTAKTKELAAIGKAAAIAQATIATITGATRAYADFPFPFSLIVSGLVAAAGAVNIARISGVDLATGITEVPPGFQNDTFPANLSSGERVVSAPQNKDLTEFLSGSSGLSAKLDQLIGILATNGGRTVVSIDGREIVTAIQDQIDSGRALNV